MSRRFLSPLRLTNLTSDPDGGSEGDIYFNSVTKSLRFHNGIDWIELADTGIASQTQKYLLDHKHTYDGEIAEIIPSNTLYPETIISETMNGSVTTSNPILVLDGGSPTDYPPSPSSSEFTLADGGGV